MMNLKTVLFLFVCLLGVYACNENRIAVKEGRMSMAEPDKELRIMSELNESLVFIATEINNSNKLDSCEHAIKIINSGIEILPYLKEKFADSTKTEVFSTYNNRNLTLGEIAIVLAGKIKLTPIFYVVGIQQCTPPYDSDLEHFLYRIEEDPNKFIAKYSEWLKRELSKKK